MSKIDCYMIDVHLANRCNLMCDGCNHWSNYGFSEIFSAKTLYEWAAPWADLINPERVNLLGGEPLLNPECRQIIKDYRSLFPNATLKFFTNGFTLSKNLWLQEVLRENNCVLVITMHSSEKRYLKKFTKELQCLNSFGNCKLKMKTWFRTVFDFGGIEVEIRDMRGHWYKTYTGNGINARPYKDNSQRKSWEECVSKKSVQLYHGKLHKCGAITYLPDFLEKYNLTENKEWKPYLQYKGLEHTSSFEDIKEFFLKEDEWICNMCPKTPDKKNTKEVFKRFDS
jgi:hypothetical protein